MANSITLIFSGIILFYKLRDYIKNPEQQ
jgi:uncharacterized protein with PQ loop repeat